MLFIKQNPRKKDKSALKTGIENACKIRGKNPKAAS